MLLEAEGPPAAVDALVAWCRRGPSLAQVSSVAVDDLAVTGEAGFTIRR